jgi:hypothetical protein
MFEGWLDGRESAPVFIVLFPARLTVNLAKLLNLQTLVL